MPSRPEQRSRRSYLAAPPLTQSENAAEAAEVIRESPGPEGIVLAGALRDLMLWVETPESERKAAFDPSGSVPRVEQIKAAGLDEDLWVPTLTLAGVVDDPCGANSRRLLYACQRVVSWAEERGRPATKLAFAQAAALLRPDDAKLALEVARLARELGDQARAESWFRHTVRLTRANDWETYVWAYVGLGVLYIRAGNLAGAQTVILRALKTATRHRLRPLAGIAHHHLFHLAAEAGRARTASEHVLAALNFYGPAHPRLPYLVSDLARFWLEIGQFRPSLALFEKVILVLTDTNEQAMVSANSTWAAALAADPETYERLRRRTIALVRDTEGRSYLDDTYAAIASADLLMNNWQRAAVAAEEAVRLAVAGGNVEVRYKAEGLRDLALAEQIPAHSPETAAAGFTRHAESLTGDLLNALAHMR